MMEDWAQLVGYCVESRCMPTLLVYEEYSNEASMSITMSRMYSLKDEIDMTRPEWENLQFKAMEADSCIGDMMDNSMFIQEQQQMFEELNKQSIGPSETFQAAGNN